MGGIPENNKEIRLNMAFSIDSKIASGKGEFKNLNNYIHNFGYKNIGILCDKNLYDSSFVLKIGYNQFAVSLTTLAT